MKYKVWRNDLFFDAQSVVYSGYSKQCPVCSHQQSTHHWHITSHENSTSCPIEISTSQQPAPGQPYEKDKGQQTGGISNIVSLFWESSEWNMYQTWGTPVLLFTTPPEPCPTPHTYHHHHCCPYTHQCFHIKRHLRALSS